MRDHSMSDPDRMDGEQSFSTFDLNKALRPSSWYNTPSPPSFTDENHECLIFPVHQRRQDCLPTILLSILRGKVLFRCTTQPGAC